MQRRKLVSLLVPVVALAVSPPVLAMAPQSTAPGRMTADHVITNEATTSTGKPYGRYTVQSVRFSNLPAGSHRVLSAVAKFTRLQPTNVEVDVIIKCLDLKTRTTSAFGNRGQNTNSANPTLSVRYDWLLTVPTGSAYTGGNYLCTQSVEAHINTTKTTYAPGAKLATVVASGTVLKYSSVDEAGSYQVLPNECPSNDTQGGSGCVYVTASRPTRYPLYAGDGGGPSYRWLSRAGATSVDSLVGLQVTTCNATTKSCYYHGSSTFTDIDVRLELLQINGQTGATCSRSFQPASGFTRYRVTNARHHFVINLRKTAPISFTTACGVSKGQRARFLLRAQVKYVAGNPLKLDARSGSLVRTNGILMNL